MSDTAQQSNASPYAPPFTSPGGLNTSPGGRQHFTRWGLSLHPVGDPVVKHCTDLHGQKLHGTERSVSSACRWPLRLRHGPLPAGKGKSPAKPEEAQRTARHCDNPAWLASKGATAGQLPGLAARCRDLRLPWAAVGLQSRRRPSARPSRLRPLATAKRAPIVGGVGGGPPGVKVLG